MLWIAEQLATANAEHEPELGGPTKAKLADALRLYAELYTINKGGFAPLKRVSNDTEGHKLVEYERRPLPQAWQEHNDARRTARSQTYVRIAELAKKRCSAISTADLRRLVADMKREGLSESTVQKEVALLKHMFNVAASEWSWKGFENPCKGIKLGKSDSRFVLISKQQREQLWDALAECDNPYFWPLIELELQTTLRRSSLLALRWNQVDLDGRIFVVASKTGQVAIPMTQHAVRVLSEMPRSESSMVFPMTANAVDCAWDGVRVKAGIPTLQFRDLRHVAATDFARRGFNSHQLMKVLGHKTITMAQTYVNLVSQDVLDVMDRTEPASPVLQLPPPASGSGTDMFNRKRSTRLTQAVRERMGLVAAYVGMTGVDEGHLPGQ